MDTDRDLGELLEETRRELQRERQLRQLDSKEKAKLKVGAPVAWY